MEYKRRASGLLSNVSGTLKSRSLSAVGLTKCMITLKMKLVSVFLLALQCKLTIVTGDEKEHVHFKIYVPEIIKHHVHTKTVFIHVYEPKKKTVPQKNEHVDSHLEDWNIWSSYKDYNEHGDRYDRGHHLVVNGQSGKPPQNVQQHHHRIQVQNEGYVTPFDGLITSPGPSAHPIDNAYPSLYRKHPEPPVPHYDDFRTNYPSIGDHYHPGNHALPVKSVFRNGVTGYSYPPQYAVQENVIEDDPDHDNLENYKNTHEEGHSKRLHSETGHLYTNELSNFYDDKNEESHEAVSMESTEVDDTSNRDSYRYVGDDYLTGRMIGR